MNSVMSLARCGCKVDFYTIFGNDEISKMLKTMLIKEGVNISNCLD